ncbi:hypothetical protein [Saccharicrinis sp. FJH54]|uniref:hypothetical protein n=1 Tax=Saccharicrinis sp. FJH54 TaxID=3344665 RepID=UPI0035D460B4
MKKRLLKITSLLFALIIFTSQTQAGNYVTSLNSDNEIDEFFAFNESEIYDSFESSVLGEYADNINDAAALLPLASEDDPYAMDEAFGIPSFLWGCVGGVTGIILVKVITEDNREAKKAFTGCLMSYILAGVVYAVYIVEAVNQ